MKKSHSTMNQNIYLSIILSLVRATSAAFATENHPKPGLIDDLKSGDPVIHQKGKTDKKIEGVNHHCDEMSGHPCGQ